MNHKTHALVRVFLLKFAAVTLTLGFAPVALGQTFGTEQGSG